MQAGEIFLEGLFQKVSEERGVVITHPHSLYGGDMYNPVVQTMVRSYCRNGFSTLRFNFRGVGRSKGQFDDGIGERKDVLAALGFLLDSGITSLHLAGYSFGSRVMAGINTLPKEVISQLYVAPPVAFMDYSDVSDIAVLQAVVVGSVDDIAPSKEIKNLLPGWNSDAKLVVIEGADHFFSSSLERLEETMDKLLCR